MFEFERKDMPKIIIRLYRVGGALKTVIKWDTRNFSI